MKLSVAIIVKNAEDTISECLESVSFADEVILVDSGSVDKTKEIAQKFKNVKIIDQEWLGFGKQKQFAVAQTTNDWVLCVDADEMITDKLRDETLNAIQRSEYKVYCFMRRNLFMGRWLKFGENLKDNVTRLFHKNYAKWSDDEVHEHVLSDEKVKKLKGFMKHKSAMSIEHYINKNNLYTSIQAKNINFKWHTYLKVFLNPMFHFVKFYVLRLGFLDGMAGFMHIIIGCFHRVIKYIKVIDNHLINSDNNAKL